MCGWMCGSCREIDSIYNKYLYKYGDIRVYYREGEGCGCCVNRSKVPAWAEQSGMGHILISAGAVCFQSQKLN